MWTLAALLFSFLLSTAQGLIPTADTTKMISLPSTIKLFCQISWQICQIFNNDGRIGHFDSSDLPNSKIFVIFALVNRADHKVNSIRFVICSIRKLGPWFMIYKPRMNRMNRDEYYKYMNQHLSDSCKSGEYWFIARIRQILIHIFIIFIRFAQQIDDQFARFAQFAWFAVEVDLIRLIRFARFARFASICSAKFSDSHMLNFKYTKK